MVTYPDTIGVPLAVIISLGAAAIIGVGNGLIVSYLGISAFIATLADRIDNARRDAQRHQDAAEKVKSELRSLLMSHLSLIERAVPTPVAVASDTAVLPSQPPLIVAEVDETDELPINGKTTHRIVE